MRQLNGNAPNVDPGLENGRYLLLLWGHAITSILYVDSTSTPLMGGIPALSTQNIARWTRQLNDKQNHSICAPGGVAALAVETMR